MTRCAPPSGEPVKATPRRKMTDGRRARIHKLAGGLCAWCMGIVDVFGPGVVYDHRVPLALGGADDDHNIRPLHARPCDKLKTAFDVKQIAKAVRLRAREDGTRRERAPIKSAGFNKNLRKRMNGKVEVRT